MFCKKGVLRNFANFTGKHLRQSLLLNKVAGLRSTILLKKKLWCRCFSVNFAKFLRTRFLIEHLRWLDKKKISKKVNPLLSQKPNLRKMMNLVESDVIISN